MDKFSAGFDYSDPDYANAMADLDSEFFIGMHRFDPNYPDPDYIEAMAVLDEEFPGAVFDGSLEDYLSSRIHARQSALNLSTIDIIVLLSTVPFNFIYFGIIRPTIGLNLLLEFATMTFLFALDVRFGFLFARAIRGAFFDE